MSFIAFLVATFFAFAHVQQIITILAPAAFVIAGAWAIIRYGLLRSLFGTHVIIIATLTYILAITLLNYGELFLMPASLINFIALEARLIYTLIFFFLFSIVLPHEKFDQLFFRAAIFVTAAICLFSLLSYFTTPLPIHENLTIGSRDGWAGRRPTGLLGGKNPFAGSVGPIVVLMVLLLTQARHYSQMIVKPLWLYIFLLLCAAVLVLCGSLGFTTGVVAAIAYIIFTINPDKMEMSRGTIQRNKLTALFIGCIGLSIFLIFHGERVGDSIIGEDENLIRRLALFSLAFERIKLSPLTGLGPSSFREVDMTIQTIIPNLISQRLDGVRLEEYLFEGDLPLGQHTHNFLLQNLTDIGFLGVGLVAVMIFSILNMRNPIIREHYQKSDHMQFCVALAKALLIYLIVSGFSAGFTFSSPSISWLFYFVLARIVSWKAYILWREKIQRLKSKTVA